MKIFKLFLLMAATIFISCSSSDDSTDTPMQTVTYEANIKAIMQNNCVSCHGNPTTNGAPMGLTTYAEVKNAVETRFLIDRINSASNPMPESGLMPISTRQLIEKWVDQGMPEN